MSLGVPELLGRDEAAALGTSETTLEKPCVEGTQWSRHGGISAEDSKDAHPSNSSPLPWCFIAP